MSVLKNCWSISNLWATSCIGEDAIKQCCDLYPFYVLPETLHSKQNNLNNARQSAFFLNAFGLLPDIKHPDVLPFTLHKNTFNLIDCLSPCSSASASSFSRYFWLAYHIGFAKREKKLKCEWRKQFQGVDNLFAFDNNDTFLTGWEKRNRTLKIPTPWTWTVKMHLPVIGGLLTACWKNWSSIWTLLLSTWNIYGPVPITVAEVVSRLRLAMSSFSPRFVN